MRHWKQHWKWIFLAIATAVIVMVKWQSFAWNTLLPLGLQTRPSLQASPSLAQSSVAVPLVDESRLLARLTDLSGERVTNADRLQIRQRLQQLCDDMGLITEEQDFGRGINLVATRPGTDPNGQTIVLAAHYDTVPNSPGADDNGSGVVVGLEVAQLLADVPTPNTLKLVFFDLEETGLEGSQAFVADVNNRANLQAAIILDMVGHACYVDGCQQYPDAVPKFLQNRSQGDFLAVIGGLQHQQLMNAFQSRSQGVPVEKLAVPINRFVPLDLLRSDHAPFWEHQIPAALVTDTANFRNPNYHQPSDTMDNINPGFLRGAAQTILEATLTLLTSTS
jgi:hypothetical protein